LSIRIAADLDETTELVKQVVAEHEGVNMTIEQASPRVLLDTDVEGFDTLAVSYFTVLGHRAGFNGRMYRI
jgi:hypothetical protein